MLRHCADRKMWQFSVLPNSENQVKPSEKVKPSEIIISKYQLWFQLDTSATYRLTLQNWIQNGEHHPTDSNYPMFMQTWSWFKHRICLYKWCPHTSGWPPYMEHFTRHHPATNATVYPQLNP
jgi:hypothetical protein